MHCCRVPCSVNGRTGRFGEPVARDTGTLLPATIATDLPVFDSSDVYLTNALFTQLLSEEFAFFAGKMDTLDGGRNAFAHRRGKRPFSNISLRAVLTL